MNLTNPYDGAGGRWLKGQLHLHTTNSDGKDHAHQVARNYEQRGYDFIVITDHRVVPSAADLAYGGPMLVIPGSEYRGGGEGELGVAGISKALPTGLDIPAYHKAALGSGGFVAFNHPTWHIHHWPIWWMLRLREAHAMEIYNAVIDWLPGPAECTDKWDRMLTCGYRLWGTATDDAHKDEHRDRGWVMVNAEPQQDAVIDALKAGRFYSSSGVTLTSLRLEDGRLVVESENAQEIRFLADRGSMRHFEKSSSASYAVREDDIYVRVELFGPGIAKAWTNPVFVETERSRELSEEFRVWYTAQQKVLAEI